MRNIFIVVIALIINVLFVVSVYGQHYQTEAPKKKLPPLTGKIQESEYFKGKEGPPTGFIKDSLSGKPIEGATVSVPDKGISDTTKADGSFNLDLQGHKGNFILSVKKDGFLPFALSANKIDFSNPFTLHIEKQQGQIVVDHNIHHLGDNNFSQDSANAAAFRLPSEGPVFMKEFYVEALPANGMVLKIGSIIGLDTVASRQLGQSHIDAYSSPLSIYVNSVKIAEIAINSDNKIIPISNSVLKQHSKNLLVLQTGVNQVVSFAGQMDYDDIEFMNVLLEKAN